MIGFDWFSHYGCQGDEFTSSFSVFFSVSVVRELKRRDETFILTASNMFAWRAIKVRKLMFIFIFLERCLIGIDHLMFCVK